MSTSTLSKKQKNGSALDKIRRFGGYMSGMVMPNLGAFVGWGLLAALFIPTGWLPNKELNNMVGPILNYLLPLLIGYTAGYNIHGQRGGVIGAFATMGVVVGSSVTMFSGAMIMGPLAAWLLKKVDGWFEDKIPTGFEMFVYNFDLGIIGFILAIIGYLAIGPAVNGIVVVLTAGINFLIKHGLIPLLSIFMAPGQVLFLNNAINHGIIGPIAYEQAKIAGKSLMFLVDSNCGPSLGVLLAIWLYGKGKAKQTAPMAIFIAGIAGIGEVYFPFILANPVLVFATMGGMAVSLSLLVLLGGGLVAMPSPGSLINIGLMTPKDAIFANFVAIAAGFAVSFLLAGFLLKTIAKQKDDTEVEMVGVDFSAALPIKQNSPTMLNSSHLGPVTKLIVACDSGMGSSAFGVSVLKNRLNKEGFGSIVVKHVSTNNIDEDADLVVTLDSLEERAKMSVKNKDLQFVSIKNFLDNSDYDPVFEILRERNK